MRLFWLLLLRLCLHVEGGKRKATLSPKLEDGEFARRYAVVTLVSGASSGYTSGAIALGQSLVDVGSKMSRVVMVTPDVDKQSRDRMSKLWQVKEVPVVLCNHKHQLDAKEYDLNGDKYTQGVQRWSTTCTKFQAWNLVEFEKVIFMDSDMLVVGPVDDALFMSNASFAASPESFPPDTFNAGFMVIKPSKEGFAHLLELNKRVGSAEGGDQGVLNNGLCPNWFSAPPSDLSCGRLPWLFNVEVAHYNEYKVLRKMSNQREPSVIHFVSDGKPWVVLLYEYLPQMQSQVPRETLTLLSKQAAAHILWRDAFFRATGEAPSKNDFLIRTVHAAQNDKLAMQQQQQQKQHRGEIEQRENGSPSFIEEDTEAPRKRPKRLVGGGNSNKSKVKGTGKKSQGALSKLEQRRKALKKKRSNKKEKTKTAEREDSKGKSSSGNKKKSILLKKNKK